MKKYLALLLAVLMLAAIFAGCASTAETTTDTPAASTETAEPAKTEEADAEQTTTEEAPASEEGKVFNIYVLHRSRGRDGQLDHYPERRRRVSG